MPEIKFNQGQNTSEDSKELAAGELIVSQNAEYRIGDRNRIWKTPGRSIFSDLGTDVKSIGVGFLQFDTSTGDQIVAMSDGTLYGATPGNNGAFASLETGLDSTATRLGFAHYEDRQYIVNGKDRMSVLNSSKSVRKAGMLAPTLQPVGTPAAGGGTATRPGATVISNDNSFSNYTNARDGLIRTYSSKSVSSASTVTATWGGWTARAFTGSEKVSVRFGVVGGTQILDPLFQEHKNLDAGTTGVFTKSGFNVVVTVNVSEDTGSTFREAYSQTIDGFTGQPYNVILELDTATDDSQVQIKVSMQYVSGVLPATLRVYDHKIQVGSGTAAVDTTQGLRYAFTEYDENTGLESPPSPISVDPSGNALISVLGSASSHNQVSFTVPTAATNSNATHYIYYRTPDGGTVPQDLGQVGIVEIGSGKVFVDDFEVYQIGDQPGPPLEMVGIEVDGGILRFIANQPPPLLDDITHYDGSLVGIKDRALFHSMPGRPESWPEINLIAKFPFKEHDTLIGMATTDKSLVMGAKQVIIILDGLPRIDSGIVNSSDARKLDGAPGLVSQYAMTEYADDDDSGGESRVAWVSRFGVHETNGFRHRRLTSDIDWENEVSQADLANAVLHWNPELQHLIFAYSASRYALIHMADEHRKADGRPKITWGHFGRLSDMASGFVDGEYLIYSSHPSHDKIYLERNGLTDSSNTTGNENMPMKLKTGRIYGDDEYNYFTRGRLRHSDAGKAQTATVTVDSGIDNPKEIQASISTVAIDGNSGTQFAVLQSGEWHQITVEYTGRNLVSFSGVRAEIENMANSGAIA